MRRANRGQRLFAASRVIYGCLGNLRMVDLILQRVLCQFSPIEDPTPEELSLLRDLDSAANVIHTVRKSLSTDFVERAAAGRVKRGF